jgi:TPP-dependent pyruvate/acetoin dehydrogenase alpha subunit
VLRYGLSVLAQGRFELEYSKTLLLSMYESMLKQRLLEEEVAELYRKGLIPGLAHPYIGQEAIAAGICATLQKEDLVVSNHRGHGHSVAKGIPEQTILSELMGKETGMCLGIGGSMHSVDLQAGMIFSTAIVGGGIPLANGVALALKKSKKGNCVVCFFGDGATNTGAFHEGLNLAALWKLPVVFVCENNKYAVSVPLSKSTSAPIVQRGQAYGIPSLLVDGMNVFEVYAAALKATSGARRGEGPTLMECDTYRYRGHGLYDTSLDYRTQEEINEWIKRDPILQFEKKVTSERLASTEELEVIRSEVQSRVKEASKFAQNAPYPSVDLLSRFVWA